MKGYRTLCAAFLTIAAGVLAQTDWVSVLNDPKAGAIAIITGILMAIMRFLTSTPVGHEIHPAEVELKKPDEKVVSK